MEKLAREICWMGFSNPKAVGKTKAKYWQSLPPVTQNEYRTEAVHFVRILSGISSDLLNEIEIERSEDWKLSA